MFSSYRGRHRGLRVVGVAMFIKVLRVVGVAMFIKGP